MTSPSSISGNSGSPINDARIHLWKGIIHGDDGSARKAYYILQDLYLTQAVTAQHAYDVLAELLNDPHRPKTTRREKRKEEAQLRDTAAQLKVLRADGDYISSEFEKIKQDMLSHLETDKAASAEFRRVIGELPSRPRAGTPERDAYLHRLREVF